MAFDANRDLKIDAAQQDDGTFTLQTVGLAARGRAELEIVRVPDEASARHAAVVINMIANYVVTKKPVAAGERIAVPAEWGSVIARLVESPGAGKRGLGKFFGGGQPVRLRIEEPVDGMDHLKTLLSTVLLWKAHVAREQEDLIGAAALLREAIALFPGDPRRADAPTFGVHYNWENHLAYKALADIVEDSAESLVLEEHAIERCSQLRDEEIGDTVASLGDVTPDELLDRARHILTVNARPTPAIKVNDILSAVTSPIWRRRSEGAARRQNVVPASQVYSSVPLLRDPALVALAVELVESSVQRPVVISRVAATTMQHWEGGAGEAPFVPLNEVYRAGDQLLSLSLAHVARLHAGDLTPAQIRAFCALGGDDAVYNAAAQKYADLEAAEGEAIMAAMMA